MHHIDKKGQTSTEIEEEKLETRKERFGQVTQNKEKKMENQEKKNRGSG